MRTAETDRAPILDGALPSPSDGSSRRSDDRATRLGAAVAYYTIFSLAPLLVGATGLFGAEFTQVYAHRYGHHVRPVGGATSAARSRSR
ncbi:MAG: hypothetical protein ACREOS_04810 [Candidatus Dormibacteraceae bacterium]